MIKLLVDVIYAIAFILMGYAAFVITSQTWPWSGLLILVTIIGIGLNKRNG